MFILWIVSIKRVLERLGNRFSSEAAIFYACFISHFVNLTRCTRETECILFCFVLRSFLCKFDNLFIEKTIKSTCEPPLYRYSLESCSQIFIFINAANRFHDSLNFMALYNNWKLSVCVKKMKKKSLSRRSSGGFHTRDANDRITI